MKYFNSLPKVRYTNDSNVSTIYTNLLARASVIPSMLNNALNFYDYDIQDGDTPEIVAYKYYGDTYRYWVVLYINQMNDPHWDWPLDTNNFEKFVTKKYNTILQAQAELHHFEKVVTKTSRTTGTDSDITTTVETTIITQDDLLEIQPIAGQVITYTFDTETVDVITKPRPVSNYLYEIELNESKRSIKLLNKSFIDQFEKEFTELMK